MRRYTLGSYPKMSLADAREMARGEFANIEKGVDVAAVKKQARLADSFDDLAHRYLENHAKKLKRTWEEDERVINRDLLPAWRNRKAGDITRRDVKALIQGIADRGAGVMANRTLALISKIFNFAVEEEVVSVNPAYRVPKAIKEQSRSRVLSEDEIKAVWLALDGQRQRVAAIFRLLLLTGQRKSEVTGMRWQELDLERGWWTIPEERSKNGLAHRVPLAPQALAILRSLGEAHDPIFVFRGGRVGQPIANLQKVTKKIKEASNVDFRVHDCRRTAASLMTGLGVQRLVVSKILNHVDGETTGIYDRHTYDAEKRAALEKWDRHVSGLVAVSGSGAVAVAQAS